jgi:hypothetical protein
MESAQADMIDDLGDIFYGSGAGYNPEGLANIVDNGTVAATYRGLTRASYDALDAYVSTSVGTLELSDLQALDDNTTIGNWLTSLWITTPAVFSYIENLLFPTQQAIVNMQRISLNRNGFSPVSQGLGGEFGFVGFTYRGRPIVKDPKCTAGYLYALNEEKLYWATKPHPVHGTVNLGSSTIDNPQAPSANHGIAWTGLKEPTNADGQTGQFLLYGNFICDNPRTNGVKQGITG